MDRGEHRRLRNSQRCRRRSEFRSRQRGWRQRRRVHDRSLQEFHGGQVLGHLPTQLGCACLRRSVDGCAAPFIRRRAGAVRGACDCGREHNGHGGAVCGWRGIRARERRIMGQVHGFWRSRSGGERARLHDCARRSVGLQRALDRIPGDGDARQPNRHLGRLCTGDGCRWHRACPAGERPVALGRHHNPCLD